MTFRPGSGRTTGEEPRGEPKGTVPNGSGGIERKTVMIFYLVRHGQTDWNAREIVQGCTDIPLNETGLAQAARARDLLRDAPIDVIFTSPLIRAVRTAEIINEAHGVPMIREPRLRERNYGIYEAASYSVYPGVAFWDYERNMKAEGAETVREVFERVYRCLDDIRRDYAGQCVMLAMHGGAARAVYCYFNGMPEGRPLKSIFIPNAEPMRFEIADNAPAVMPLP